MIGSHFCILSPRASAGWHLRVGIEARLSILLSVFAKRKSNRGTEPVRFESLSAHNKNGYRAVFLRALAKRLHAMREGFERVLRYILEILISKISETRTEPVRFELPTDIFGNQ
jgi:hypothetical protein